MKRAIHGAISILVLAVLNVLSLGIHAAATLPMNVGHSMGTSHQTSSVNCFTICTTATLNKEDVVKDVNEEEDDKLQSPSFVQFQSSPLAAFEDEHTQKAKSLIDREPPPDDTPAYIKLAVFRA